MEKGQNEQKIARPENDAKGNSNPEAGSLKENSGISNSGFLGSIQGNWMAYLLIGLINLAGLLIIAKILKKS